MPQFTTTETPALYKKNVNQKHQGKEGVKSTPNLITHVHIRYFLDSDMKNENNAYKCQKMANW